MPVAQLVHLFENIEQPQEASGHNKSRNMFKRMSLSSKQRLSLKTMFRSHARIPSSSSGAGTASPAMSPSSPAMSSHSLDLLSASTYTSTASERSSDPFTRSMVIYDFPEPKPEKSVRTTRAHRMYSSTSLALQSQYKIDQTATAGLDFFEPRPHGGLGVNHATLESMVLDGILEVMESG